MRSVQLIIILANKTIFTRLLIFLWPSTTFIMNFSSNPFTFGFELCNKNIALSESWSFRETFIKTIGFYFNLQGAEHKYLNITDENSPPFVLDSTSLSLSLHWSESHFSVCGINTWIRAVHLKKQKKILFFQKLLKTKIVWSGDKDEKKALSVSIKSIMATSM